MAFSEKQVSQCMQGLHIFPDAQLNPLQEAALECPWRFCINPETRYPFDRRYGCGHPGSLYTGPVFDKDFLFLRGSYAQSLGKRVSFCPVANFLLNGLSFSLTLHVPDFKKDL